MKLLKEICYGKTICARLGQERNAHRVLVEKPAGKREFERRKRRCENRMKMNLKGIVWQAGLIGFRQLSDCCEEGNEPQSCVNCGEFLN